MEKISVTELKEMIKSKFAEKGVTSEDINEEVLKSITERIKSEVNSNVAKAQENSVNNDDSSVSVDISSQPLGVPGETPEAITTSTEVAAPDAEEIYRKEGELEEKERLLRQKEEELRRMEEELENRKKEMEYQPIIPEKFQDMGSEKFFVFDKNTLSAGSEKLSKLDMNLVDEPDRKTNMHDLWLKDGKRNSEIFLVNFEKIGDIIFNPFEGTSEFVSSFEQEKELSGPTSTDDYEDSENSIPGNMVDSIAPIKDVTQPMSNNMGLDVQSGEYQNIDSNVNVVNVPEEDFENLLNSKLKEIVKDYLSGQLVLGQKKND